MMRWHNYILYIHVEYTSTNVTVWWDMCGLSRRTMQTLYVPTWCSKCMEAIELRSNTCGVAGLFSPKGFSAGGANPFRSGCYLDAISPVCSCRAVHTLSSHIHPPPPSYTLLHPPHTPACSLHTPSSSPDSPTHSSSAGRRYHRNQ